ncbi:rod shape-determining protein MreC [Candidatus Legionella polyplacis]|uniref:Cell shape-determining protein MreC n=1 Tax=Candidatus Legionella polyplacis TaxID=2005262 RepID=A0ABZ2H197_9GAMM
MGHGKKNLRCFLFFLFFSFVLMICDFYYSFLGMLRNDVLMLFYPVKYIIDGFVKYFQLVYFSFVSKFYFVKEIKKLNYEIFFLKIRLHRLNFIERENLELRRLLFASIRKSIKTMVADVMFTSINSSKQIMVLNKGSNDGVYIGQTVLDSKGFVGKIIDVGKNTSTVLLIIDSKSAFLVMDIRNGNYFILKGNNSNNLSLINAYGKSSVYKGDVLVTSGLGCVYPEGYPIGYITNVKNITGHFFLEVTVKPFSLLNKDHLVLLLLSHKQEVKCINQITRSMNVTYY